MPLRFGGVFHDYRMSLVGRQLSLATVFCKEKFPVDSSLSKCAANRKLTGGKNWIHSSGRNQARKEDAAFSQAARGKIPEDSGDFQSSLTNMIVMTGSPWSPGPMINFSVTGCASVECPSRGTRWISYSSRSPEPVLVRTA
jgi:hypothetical protein